MSWLKRALLAMAAAFMVVGVLGCEPQAPQDEPGQQPGQAPMQQPDEQRQPGYQEPQQPGEPGGGM